MFSLRVNVLSQPLHEFCTVSIAYKFVYISVSTLSNTNHACGILCYYTLTSSTVD